MDPSRRHHRRQTRRSGPRRPRWASNLAQPGSGAVRSGPSAVVPDAAVAAHAPQCHPARRPDRHRCSRRAGAAARGWCGPALRQRLRCLLDGTSGHPGSAGPRGGGDGLARYGREGSVVGLAVGHAVAVPGAVARQQAGCADVGRQRHGAPDADPLRLVGGTPTARRPVRTSVALPAAVRGAGGEPGGVDGHDDGVLDVEHLDVPSRLPRPPRAGVPRLCGRREARRRRGGRRGGGGAVPHGAVLSRRLPRPADR